MPTPLVAVHGTHADQGDRWHRLDSAWWRMMERNGFEPINRAVPFEWSGDLIGADPWRAWLSWLPFVRNNLTRRLNDWIVAGTWLRIYIEQFPERRIVAHSHGLHPVLIAAAQGCRIHSLVSLGSPFRADVAEWIWSEYAVGARQRIDYWAHVRDRDDDKIATLGGIGDGTITLSRMYRAADVNIGVRGIGHSGLVKADSEPVWRDAGLFDQIRTTITL